jgi:uncharacterized membrane-anchored protein YitT (DUF2179 family)
MIRFIKSFLANKAIGNLKSKGLTKNQINRFAVVKEVSVIQRYIIRETKNYLLLFVGILAAGFGLMGFLIPKGFIDGGIMGVSLIAAKTTGFNLSILIILINLPFIVLGYKTFGKNFSFKTSLAILLLSLAVAIIPYPVVTVDNILVAVFGGFFVGMGIGFAVRGGGVLDGTEILSIFISRKLNTTIGDIIFIINVFIFSAAAILISVDAALYSMVTYFVASKTIDFIIEGFEEYIGVTIVSPKYDEIRETIINKLGKGVTIIKGEKGYRNQEETNIEIKIVYTVITRLEISKLYAEVERIDAKAFVIMESVKDIKGGLVKKRPLR